MKRLPALRLAALLAELPPEVFVTPNVVGNLRIENEAGDYLGFVDFISDGAIEIFEDGTQADGGS